jgi:hypothetical protein
VAGETVEGYYPAVIPVEQFARVQEGIQNRQRKGRGRKGRSCSNLFGSLLHDARDGRRNQGQHSKHKNPASNALAGSVLC